ncbi:hypothetical protein A5819_002521 [Enterococcus sp. 7E2_DIV0204]|uniref:hypothetical protein n=1 Tax=unclassified Enterococcus TaxID=2608891 RepID=UPI000A33F043|nr:MULTISPECIES: hypothetical protein [unclassified Enterococcus]OTN90022.1 hypothetical protein A5819_002521 [Enterococcus sp. 7E2_DIV0204]OTP52479.1 hypothetical protein A5884_001681 [Enterococcus sp. 7D2_DIV0200]
MAIEITEYIEMGRFNSKEAGYYILEHDSPSPDEQEIIEGIPFMQGVYDFSMLLGERVFDNRKLTIKLYRPLTLYEDRKRLEQEAKEQLMLNKTSAITDSWLGGCHWLGKCTSVFADDDQSRNSLTLTLTFDCYPFALKNAAGYTDEFDVDYFVDGVDQWTGFFVKGQRTILLINEGVNATSPTITATGKMQLITGAGERLDIQKGQNQDLFFKLQRGENYLTIHGNGHLSFVTETEVMV